MSDIVIVAGARTPMGGFRAAWPAFPRSTWVPS